MDLMFLDILYFLDSVNNIKSARCDLLLDGTTFLFEMLVFFS